MAHDVAGLTNLTESLGDMSLCTRSRVGAVLVDRAGAILGIGWNTGRNCEVFCPRGQFSFASVPSDKPFDVARCITQHAEMRCLQSVRENEAIWHRTSVRRDHPLTMYVAVRPNKDRGTCEQCTPILQKLGIEVIYV